MKENYWILLLCMIVSGCTAVNKIAASNTEGEKRMIPFDDPHLQYEGRIGKKNGAAEFYWSGSAVRLHFEGTGIKALLKDYNGQNYFNIIIDGDCAKKIRIDSAKKWYLLAENLTSGPHTVELFKRTQINKEYKRGYTRFYGFQLNDGNVLPPPIPKKRKIEFYGNSITCGHAIEDTSGSDSGAAVFENNYLSYAALTARHYHAQYSCIAVSGIGLMAGFRKFTMPEIYDLRDPFDSTDRWDFSQYIPGVVVVNLLQNDEAVINNPGNEQFKKRFGTTPPADEFIVSSYKDFILKLRAHYPGTSIICVLGNMAITKPGSKWPGLVQKAIEELHDKNIFTHFFRYKGTPGHPNAREHQRMAGSLIEFIDANIHW